MPSVLLGVVEMVEIRKFGHPPVRIDSPVTASIDFVATHRGAETLARKTSTRCGMSSYVEPNECCH
jgi:hypothetical protein